MDTSDLNHMGFVVQFGNGRKVYVTGDTANTELLLGVTKHSPDIVITVINGEFNNFSHWQAADLMGKISPRLRFHATMACSPTKVSIRISFELQCNYEP